MKIEEGKFYKTRDGRKVGPMKWSGNGFFYPDGSIGAWRMNGTAHDSRTNDVRGPIISEWPSYDTDTGPIRTIMRREIVPGVYGAVEIDLHPEGGLLFGISANNWNAEELREAAHILNQLAEYLESKEGK